MIIVKSKKSFKDYCDCCLCPKYIKEYVNKLNVSEFENFYEQFKEAMAYLKDKEYLIYKLYWILKKPFKDLSFELYSELTINIEGFKISSIISKRSLDMLENKYANDFAESVLHQEDIDLFSNNDNTLPV